MLVQRRREMKAAAPGTLGSGWEQLLDMDRDGAVDDRDIDLFRRVALNFDAAHSGH
jgi:hypothetical protein